jgi:hypothetical protein
MSIRSVIAVLTVLVLFGGLIWSVAHNDRRGATYMDGRAVHR